MNNHDRLYDSPEDIQRLKDTALKNVDISFQSFTMKGNEDSPTEVRLYQKRYPYVNDTYTEIKLEN